MPEPITLTEAKKHMRIDDDYTYDDDLINLYIKSNREWMEKQLNLSLVEKTGLKQKYNRGCHCVEPGKIYINYGPVTSGFTILSTGLTPTPLVLDSDYWNCGTDEFPVIYANQSANITYNAGYSATTIPSDLKLALLMLVASNYEMREDYEPAVNKQATRLMYSQSRNLYL